MKISITMRTRSDRPDLRLGDALDLIAGTYEAGTHEAQAGECLTWAYGVELRGLEPRTSCMPCKRSST